MHNYTLYKYFEKSAINLSTGTKISSVLGLAVVTTYITAINRYQPSMSTDPQHLSRNLGAEMQY